MIKIFEKLLLILFNILLAPVLFFTVKSKKTLVFGERLGQTYKDNSRFLYEFSIKNKKNYKSIWITENKKIYKKLKKEKKNVLYRDSLKALYYITIAKYIFITVDFKDVSRIIKIFCRLNIIQLWHGTQLKKSVVDVGKESYKYHIIASKEFQIKQKTSISKKIKKILTGYPRNDILSGIKTNKKFTIAYFPTYTKQFDFFIEPTITENLEINKFKKKNKCDFYISLHPSQSSKNLLAKNNTFFKILNINPTYNVYKFLNNVDILITDISSIFFDFLIINKPIIFMIKDKNFSKIIPLRFNYKNFLPGPIVSNWQGALKEIEKFKNNKDIYVKRRKKISKRFNFFNDKLNSKRVFEKLKI